MIDQELLDVLVCPWCLGSVSLEAERLVCNRCGTAYSVEDGIPNMLVVEADVSCPLCKTPLEKNGGTAACARCDRQFDLTRRLEADLIDQAPG